MKRTTGYLDERMDLEPARLARQQARPKVELIREALEPYLARGAKPRRLPRSVGMGRSDVPDLAERDKALLGELLEEDYARGMAARREERR